jgi:hypothetical protein
MTEAKKGFWAGLREKKPIPVDAQAEEESAGCGCSTSCCSSPAESASEPAAGVPGAVTGPTTKKLLAVELFVIDLTSCKRCVPTGEQLKAAVDLLAPVANALGIELRHRETVVETVEQAKEVALLSSPTIRLNGRDVVQDIRESLCESCGDLTDNDTAVDCREWHYRGQVYSAAPLPLLVEAIMGAMLDIDRPALVTAPLKELPENLQRYFKNKKSAARCC